MPSQAGQRAVAGSVRSVPAYVCTMSDTFFKHHGNPHNHWSKSAAFEITAKLIAQVPPPAVHHGVSAVGPLQLPSLVDVSKSRPIVSSADIFVRHEYPKELPTGWPRI